MYQLQNQRTFKICEQSSPWPTVLVLNSLVVGSGEGRQAEILSERQCQETGSDSIQLQTVATAAQQRMSSVRLQS